MSASNGGPASAGLLPHHAELIKASAIAEDIALARGYWSAIEPKQLERWFGSTQRRLVPALVVPVHDVHGEVAFCQLRPDDPRVVKGKRLKYETPSGARMVVDVPPKVRPVLGDPSKPLVITEGARKADSAVTVGLYAIDLIGVWNWRGTNGNGGKLTLADWESIALNERVVYLAFDSDAMTKREVHQALERFAGFLRKRKADVRFIYLPSDDGGAKTGLDDYIAAGHGRDDVLALATDELRPLGNQSHGKPDNPPVVDSAVLLADIREFITRHMVLPSPEAADLLALWALHTWAFAAAFATPYLRITSATPDSGKTLLMEILAAVTRNGWHAVNPSPAVLYRKIDRHAPTLLLDEIDNFPLDERRDALSVLNAGYKRGAMVDRCDDRGELQAFNCFCPKAYAGLDTKSLVPALLSRSITIRLVPKTAAESVEMWIAPLAEPEAQALRERCGAWAHHNVEALSEARPAMPDGFVNRTVEAWWALLAIADRVGGDWPTRARAAARQLSAGGDALDDRPEAVTLLADIHQAFGDAETIFTKILLDDLNERDESPWGARRKGEGLDARGLSRLLRPFGIKPRTVRVGTDTAKGYHVAQFGDVLARYLPDALDYPSHPSQPSQPALGGKPDVTDVTDVTDKSGRAQNVQRDNGLREPTCRHDEHRDSDWAMPGAERWICGICHPPPQTLRDQVHRRHLEAV